MSPSIIETARTGNGSNVIRDMRVRSLFSSYYFVKVVLGYSRITDYFHQEEMDRFLEVIESGNRKQCIEWSRGFFKTSCFTIGTGIWFVLPFSEEDTEYAINVLGIPEDAWFRRINLHNQDYTQLLAFETMDNAKKKVEEIKWHFEENDLFRTVFPEIAYTGTESPWNSVCLKIQRTKDGKRIPEGTFEAIGVEGTLQSRHYDIVWEDDLVGKRAVESESVMIKTIRWHGLLHGAFTDASRGFRFLVSNRWGYADLNSSVRENESDFVFHTRRAKETREDGEEYATFPIDGLGIERYTLEALAAIEHQGSMTPYDFSCQYLNEPILPGQAEVDSNKLHTYTVDHDGCMLCSCGAKWYPSQCNRYLHYDPYNAKGLKSKSCPALAAVALAPDHHIFLLEYRLAKAAYSGIFNVIYGMNDRWSFHTFTYEDVGHQNMTEFHMREVAKTDKFKEKHKPLPTIVPSPPGTNSKISRIRENLLPFIENGKFSRRSIHTTFDTMLKHFPSPSLTHDYDLLDALTQGKMAKVWVFPSSYEEIQRDAEENTEYLKHLGVPYTHIVGGEDESLIVAPRYPVTYSRNN